jgi:hypothetical protein
VVISLREMSAPAVPARSAIKPQETHRGAANDNRSIVPTAPPNKYCSTANLPKGCARIITRSVMTTLRRAAKRARTNRDRYNFFMTVTAPPRLLVSVRNASEAEAALAGGCDVLDIKEPERGAMGRADPATIAAVVRLVRSADAAVPVSVALGEVTDWEPNRAIPHLPEGIAYCKFGTAGLGNARDWGVRLAAVIGRFNTAMRAEARMSGETASDAAEQHALWIAVGYADWEWVRGPQPEEAIAQAAKCGCGGVLFDTYSKGCQRLVDWLSIERLVTLAAMARARGLLFALAGKLQIGDLPGLTSTRPDIVGIRSAACRAGIRTGEIDPSAVRAFREALL